MTNTPFIRNRDGITRAILPGVWIVEKQKGSTKKRVRFVRPDAIICVSLSGHRSVVKRCNLHRYEVTRR